MAIGEFMEQSLQNTLSCIRNQGQFPCVFLRALINSSSITGALIDLELDGSHSGATFSIGLAWLIWVLVKSVFAFSYWEWHWLFHRGKIKPRVLDSSKVPGGLGLGSCERCTVAAFLTCLKGNLQSNWANRDSWKVKLCEKLVRKRSLEKNPREFSAPFPKTVFTTTVQLWVLTDSSLGFCPAHPGEGR